MYTEEQIDDLVDIIMRRQEQANLYVLKKIAQKIKEIGTMTPSDVESLIRMRATGADVRDINKALARFAGIRERDIKRLIQMVALDSYKEAKPFYDYRKKPFIPFKDNKPLQKIVRAIIKQTAGACRNLSRALAFMIRDPLNRKVVIATPLAEAYQSVVDEAIQLVQSGVTDYKTAIRRTLQQLINSGLVAVEYEAESGKKHKQRLDSAVRRNILDGVRAINQGVQDETGRQFGADGIEITVHAYPAEDHAPVQGHQFTLEEFARMQDGLSSTDVKGNKFLGFPRAIGTLNCRHFTFSIIVGHAKPNYTDEQLQKILEENEEGYTYPDGKHLTMYECTQKMRSYELRIRQLREAVEVARTAGDEVLEKKYLDRLKSTVKHYKDFCQACGLKPRMDKTVIVTK